MLRHRKSCVFTSQPPLKYPMGLLVSTTKQYLPTLPSQKRVAKFPAIEPIGTQSTVSLIIFRVIVSGWLTGPADSPPAPTNIYCQGGDRRTMLRIANFGQVFQLRRNCTNSDIEGRQNSTRQSRCNHHTDQNRCRCLQDDPNR